MPQYTAKEKLKIVQDVKKSKYKTFACRRRNVSYQSYRTWLLLLEANDWNSECLKNKSTKPHRSPNTTSEEAAHRVYELRSAGLGRDHIAAKMRREGFQIGSSAVEGVLRRVGVWDEKKKRTRKKWKPYTSVFISYPGQKCQMDIKYVPRRIDGVRYYQYTIVDLYTRIAFRWVYDEKTPDNTVHFFKKAISFFKFKIRTLQTDNGIEFTYRMFPDWEVEHPLISLCKQHNIDHVFIPVATPRYNGVVENVHGQDQRQFYARLEKDITFYELTQKISKRNRFWNEERLHKSLGYDTPYERQANYFKKRARVNSHSKMSGSPTSQ